MKKNVKGFRVLVESDFDEGGTFAVALTLID